MEFRRILEWDLAGLQTDTLDGQLYSVGPVLADAELPDRLEFSTWLAAVRAEFHVLERKLLDELIGRAASEPARLTALWQRRIGLDPLDDAAYAGLTGALLEIGRKSEAESTISSAERLLREAGLERRYCQGCRWP